MTWIRVDDQFADHPKVMALEADRLPGLGLWHVAASYCARYLTDGFVPASHVKAHAPQRLIRRMVAVGLFDQAEGGYILHDWLDYNPNRERVLAERAAAKARMNAKRSPDVRPNNDRTPDETPVKFNGPVPVPGPTPVSTVLSDVVGNGNAVEEWVDPKALYQARARRSSLSKKERDWIEDLYLRFSRQELVAALRTVKPGSDYLKRVDAYLEGSAA